MLTLTDRKKQVLRAVVDDYVATAAPVGSRTLSRKYRMGVSPATIRNEMADLEGMGYLEQPHASAGRVPSDLGYRFYVDWLMWMRELAEAEMARITELLARRVGQMEALIQHAAQVLSESTTHLAVVLGPPLDRVSLRWVQLVPLDPGHAVLLLATSGGLVQHRLLDVPPHLEAGELEAVFSILNRRLRGRSLAEVGPGLARELKQELARCWPPVGETLEALRRCLDGWPEQGRLVMDGTARILGQPEFRDVDRARAVLSVLEQAQRVADLLNRPLAEGQVMVEIGSELKVEEIRDCSLVVASFRVGSGGVGRLGVLGPRRMEYGRVVALVAGVASGLSRTLGS